MGTCRNSNLVIAVVLVVLVLCGATRADLTDGLVAYWKLDGDAVDSAGTNNGTIYGATPTTGQINGALEFDGSGDYVDFPDGFSDFTGGLTIALWAYPTSNGVWWPKFIDFANGAGADNIIFARFETSDTLAFVVWSGGSEGGYVTANNVLELGVWQNFVVTLDGTGNAVIYKNGVPVGAGTTYVPRNINRTNNYIAKSNWNDDYYKGSIDDVRIYDRALSVEEVEELYESGLANLVGLEIVGPNEVAEDFSAQYKAIAHYDNSNTRDVTDSTDWSVEPNDIADIDAGLLETEEIDKSRNITITAEYTEGQNSEVAQKQVSILNICPRGYALEFDGQNDYVDVGVIPALGLNDDFTWSFWVKLKTGNHPADIIIGNRINEPAGPRDQLIKFTPLYFTYYNLGYSAKISYAVPTEIWLHLSVVKEGSQLSYFKNGEIVGSTTTTRDMPSIPFYLGGDPHSPYGPDEYAACTLDEVSIWNTNRSVTDIQNSLHFNLHGNEPGLIGYWNFNEGEGQITKDLSPNGNDGILGSTPEADESDPSWIESDAPVGICANVVLDIKPGSCPNPLNLSSQGVLPVAVLGSQDFDVGAIDPGSIFLEGVPTIRTSYEDVASPVTDGNECECTVDGPDGYVDLALKFRTQEIVEELINTPGDLAEGQTLALELRGELTDGRVIAGSDCVVLVGNVPKALAARRLDYNEDGIVNILDFAAMAEYWLESTAY
ncbi:MAG: LamG domain-containing protein [Planctomycetota bacterium]|jgi:hypothetical protein